jgi:hypothetical protein
MRKTLVLTYKGVGEFEPFGKPQERIYVQQSLYDPSEELVIASFKELKKEFRKLENKNKRKMGED